MAFKVRPSSPFSKEFKGARIQAHRERPRPFFQESRAGAVLFVVQSGCVAERGGAGRGGTGLGVADRALKCPAGARWFER